MIIDSLDYGNSESRLFLSDAMELNFLPLFEGTRTEGEMGVVAKIFMTR